MRNLPHDEALRGAGSGRLAAVSGKSVAASGVRLAIRANLLFLLEHLYNHLVWSDEVEELSGQSREPHLILGRREDGTIRWIRVEGALGDALEWINLRDWPADFAELADGDASLLDKAGEAVKGPPVGRVAGSTGGRTGSH